MSENEPLKSVPGVLRTAVCLLWVLAVAAAFCLAYTGSLVQYARTAAERSPLLERILELLRLGA